MAPKVGFLGNCQAQVMETWARQAGEELDIVAFPPIWLIEPSQVDATRDNIALCDYVFAQRLSDDFALTELATSRLKADFPGRIVSWPNAYFDGYFPGLGYRYTAAGKILGPLDEYHWRPIEEGYASGMSVTDCAGILDTDRILERYPEPVKASLQNLAERETGLDVMITDYVCGRLHYERLFYSMNHPVNSLMFELLHRCFGLVGERARLAALGEYAFTLDKIVLPVLPAVRRRCHIGFAGPDSIIGVDVTFDGAGYTVSDRRREYTSLEAVESFYRIYEIEERRSPETIT